MNIRMSIRRAIWSGQRRARRLARAARYALDITTRNDSFDMLLEMQNKVGCWPLSGISTGDVLERARDLYADHPALEGLCHAAAERVFSKWNSTGDENSAAVDWAMELVQRYAIEDDVDLIERAGDERETEDA